MNDVPMTHKFVVVLNKTLEPGVALNAASHMVAALVARATDDQRAEMRIIDYVDADGGTHPSSALSLIVLRGSQSELRATKAAAQERALLTTDFLESMTVDTYVEQLERTSKLHAGELTYYGVAVFGPIETLNEFTRKLSLWR